MIYDQLIFKKKNTLKFIQLHKKYFEKNKNYPVRDITPL